MELPVKELSGLSSQGRKRRGLFWHREQRYEDRLANFSRTITPSSPAASQRGHGSPSRP